MGVKAVAWALEQDVGDPRRKLVLIGLANRAADDHGAAWPGMDEIARVAGCCTRQARRHCDALAEAGVIRRLGRRRRRDGKRSASVFRLALPWADLGDAELVDQLDLRLDPVDPPCGPEDAQVSPGSEDMPEDAQVSSGAADQGTPRVSGGQGTSRVSSGYRRNLNVTTEHHLLLPLSGSPAAAGSACPGEEDEGGLRRRDDHGDTAAFERRDKPAWRRR